MIIVATGIYRIFVCENGSLVMEKIIFSDIIWQEICMFDYLAGSMYLMACQNWTFFIHLVKPLEGMCRSFIWTLRRLKQYRFNIPVWSLGSSWWHLLKKKKTSSLLKFNSPVIISQLKVLLTPPVRPLKTALKLYSCLEFAKPFDLLSFLLIWWHCRGCVG